VGHNKAAGREFERRYRYHGVARDAVVMTSACR